MKIMVNCESLNENSNGRIYSNAFTDLGHEVVKFYDILETENSTIFGKFNLVKRVNQWRIQKRNYWGWPQKFVSLLLSPILILAEIKANRILIQRIQCFDPDLFFVFKGKCIKKETLKFIKQNLRCKIFHFNGDSFKSDFSTSKNMSNCLNLYDVVFSFSYHIIQELINENIKNVKYLPFAYDKRVHGTERLEPHIKFKHDLVFVGTWDREREKILEEFKDFQLEIWGPNWNRIKRGSALKNCIKGKEINALQMKEVYKTSKFCLNIMRTQNFDSHNMKTFEIPAMGGLLLTNKSKEHSMFFKEGIDMFSFSSINEAKNIIKKNIYDEFRLMKIKKASQDKVLKNHSYKNRAQLVIAVYNKLK